MTFSSLPGRTAASEVHDDAPGPGGRFGLLLLLLIVSYLVSAFSARQLAESLQVVLFAGVILLALRTSPMSRGQVRLFGAAVLTGSLLALVAAVTHTRFGYGIAETWKALILLISAVVIVRRVLGRATVTIQSIYGALSAYLIVGLMFASCYAAIQWLGTVPFFSSGEQATPQTFQYFSFTTLTTLGYGDFTAAGNGGRAIAVLEALAGQVFLATLVARLVAAYRAPGEREWRTARVTHPERVMPVAGAEPDTASGEQHPAGPDHGSGQDGC